MEGLLLADEHNNNKNIKHLLCTLYGSNTHTHT